jgi:carboxypeptidase C (cathepsin A)
MKLMTFFLSFFILVCVACHSGETVVPPEKKPEIIKENNGLKEEIVVTDHSITLDGVEIKYKAHAGTLLLKDEKDETKASVFFVAYIKEGADPSRPLTFCFNGGPGSASIWLHMGLMGPKKILFDAEGYAQPPFQYVLNEHSFLDETDLVFIDPISTGYSRAGHNEDPKKYHEVMEDIKSVAEFIRLYTTRFNRWDSPKFLAGESYGTMRAAALANYLHEEHFYDLNGVLLISSILDFQTLHYSIGNELPYILYLPSFTAAAWYHQKLPEQLMGNLEKTLEEASHFALNDYAIALLQGDRLQPEKRKEIVKKMALYTGMPEEYVDRENLRIRMDRFRKELLRDQNMIIGRFDSQYKSFLTDACRNDIGRNNDPSGDAVYGAFAAPFNTYIRTELRWEKDHEYMILGDVNPWNYSKTASNKYLTSADDLCDVMIKIPSLKVFVASGYYDLATPYFATEYTFNHLGIDPSIRKRVTMAYYPAGHMMYTQHASLEKLKRDAAAFYRSATPSKAGH